MPSSTHTDLSDFTRTLVRAAIQAKRAGIVTVGVRLDVADQVGGPGDGGLGGPKITAQSAIANGRTRSTSCSRNRLFCNERQGNSRE